MELDIEILNYMWDNDIIIASEYDNFDTLDIDHCKILINDTIKFARKHNDIEIVETLENILKNIQ